MEFLSNNWLEIVVALMAFAKVVVNLTPSVKDDAIFGIVDRVINAIIKPVKKKIENVCKCRECSCCKLC
jgi:hypothetical protein